MTKKAIMEAILNPSRQRIIQCVVYNQPCHVNLLSKALPDIPRPSLYRHIQILKDCGLLREETVKSERGVPHRVYSFLDYSQAASAQDISVLYYTALLNLLSSFEDYFQQPEPRKVE